MIHKIITGVLAVLALLFGGSQLIDFGAPQPQGPEHRQFEAFQGGLSIGEARVGTGYKAVISGTCYLLANASIAASSSQMADCVSSSFKSGDKVIFGGLATSTTEMAKQIDILGTGSASSTNGYAPVKIFNWSGTALVPASKNGLGSSTPFTILRPY